MKLTRNALLGSALTVLAMLLLMGPAHAQRGVAVVPIVTQAGEQVGLYEESHALVIGVSKYTAGWPSLPGVKDDVRAVKAGLQAAGFAVTEVTDPTRAQLDQAIGQFIADKGQKENNRLVIYYAGHGHTLKPKYGGDPLGYVVPADAPDPNRNEGGFSRLALSMRRMEEYATQIQSKHALFVFDSCFSGTIFSTARAIPDSIQEKTAKPVRQFITAGDSGQTVPDKSIFRPEFLKGIGGDADLNKDGYVTATELGMYLSDNVTNYTRRSQTPKYGKLMHPVLNQGDFVFPVRKAKVAAAPTTPPAPRFNPEDELWASIKDSQAAEDFREYLKTYPKGKYAAVAKTRIRQIERAASSKSAPPAPAAPPPQKATVQTPSAGAIFLDPTTGMEFVSIPGGSYEQGCHANAEECFGDEKLTRRVTLRSFWLGKTEVTQAQWKQVMGRNPSRFQGDDRPVEQVSWNDVQEFIRRLNAQSGQRYRLPTEAEWEYACRAGGKPMTYSTAAGSLDWSSANFGLKEEGTTPVGKYAPNALGLADLSGNVWEWVQDVYDARAYHSGSVENPVHEGSGASRVNRGGGWYNDARLLQCSLRGRDAPSDRFNYLGFRLARTP